jgi:cysteine desulfurase / selenocysteine lyase
MTTETRRDAATDQVAAYVADFNHGVRTRDWEPMVARFAPDAELEFVGLGVPALVGHDAMRAAYAAQGPDDEIELLGTRLEGDAVIARYAWVRGEGTGELRLKPGREGIARLAVSFHPPAQAADAQASDAGDPIDSARIKLDFPILDQEIHGHRLVYLDSASTSQKPAVVIDAVDEYYRGYNANIHRGIYQLAEKSTAAWEGARVKVAKLIGAQDPHEIVFVRNATEAINLVAYSWGRKHISRGDVIVLTEMEHHANLVPWQILAQEKDADLEFIPITDDGILRQDVFDVLLNLKPKLVAFTHVSNTLGTINPVEEMTRRAHEAGALVLVDGAQAVPHVPVDVTAIGCDFYVFSGHKMLAPTGSGVLWGRKPILDAMPPFMGGGDMIREVHLRRSEWNDVPWKFEAGTPDIAAGVGLGAAADYLLEIGMDNVREHERELVAYALDLLTREVPGIELYGPPADQRGGVVPFNLPGIHPHDVAQVLDRFGIAVRAGHHCTMPLHERLDLAATARASFQVYTTKSDIDALVAGLKEVQALFAG